MWNFSQALSRRKILPVAFIPRLHTLR